MSLNSHAIELRSQTTVLRPMNEDDWPLLLQWNNDPEVRYFADDNTDALYTLETLEPIYRNIAQNALCFIIEIDAVPIGECWLQKMNIDHILAKYPNVDCRRIDLTIGDKNYWNRGIGTEVIHLLTQLAFTQESADLVFGCGIFDYNARSRKAFEKNGYQVDNKIAQPEGNKAKYLYFLICRKTDWTARHL